MKTYQVIYGSDEKGFSETEEFAHHEDAQECLERKKEECEQAWIVKLEDLKAMVENAQQA